MPSYSLWGPTGNIGVGSNAPSQANIPVMYGPQQPKKQGKPSVLSEHTQYSPQGVQQYPGPIGPQQPTPQQNTPGDFGGGGSGSDLNKNGMVWSSQEDYDKDSRTAREMGYSSAEEMRAAQDGLVNQAYSGALGVYNDVLRQIQENYPQEQQNLESSVSNEINKANTEEGQLLGDVNTQQEAFNKTLESAMQQAYRAFSALNQQKGARFGLGSSAGQAVGELAQQEFFRQQGNIQSKQADGTMAYDNERNKIKSFISQKVTDLNQFKNEALLKLKQGMEDRLNEINARRGEIEANKAKDRLAIMQDTVNRIRFITDQDKQFRRDLGLAAITNLQQVTGRAFTPKEINATLSEFGINIPNLGYTAGQGAQSPTVGFRQGNQDELSGLMNPITR